MNNSAHLQTFRPKPADAAGVLSWVQVGDLHMRAAEEQNERDLRAIVNEMNTAFAGSISFVFLPGDNADHGDRAAYEVVRQALDRLQSPWCAIVGDHDVEEKSVANFKASLAEQTVYAFTAGDARFLALNAFDIPEPSSFAILGEQLASLEAQLRAATAAGQSKVVLLHCYPSDLKQGSEELQRLLSKCSVTLVAMGHTHYNEISHDGRTIYTATRSTGQIEEGPVGFSVTNLDGGIVSWRFMELGELPAVVITSPADERLVADAVAPPSGSRGELQVRAKIWSDADVTEVEASFGAQGGRMRRIPDSNVWELALGTRGLRAGVQPLRVTAQDARGRTAVDEIGAWIGGDRPKRERAERDQDNALEAWPEHGLLGTQLGPNKNGRKW